MICVYRLELSFCGTRFFGWQKQKDLSLTVQGILEEKLCEIFKSDDIKTVASGRTDTGVHAQNLVVKIETPFFIEESGLKKALNSKLPHDIRIRLCHKIDYDFKPTYDAISRSYFYLFTTRQELSPFEAPYLVRIKNDIDLIKLAEACHFFIGKHDFANYMCKGSEPKTTIRKIESITVKSVDSSFHGLIGEHYRIDICGTGFLKQMIRIIVGVILKYAAGRLTKEQVLESLSQKQSSKLSAVMPAKGLYKASVKYPKR